MTVVAAADMPDFLTLYASAQPGNLRHVLVYGGAAPAGMLGEDLVAEAPAEPPAGETEGTVAAMIYTSGTTGKPKGAYRKITDQSTAVALIGFIGYTPDDVYLTSGPLYHSGPLAFMGVGLTLGQTIILQRKFEPEDWLRLVDKYQVTSTFSAPRGRPGAASRHLRRRGLRDTVPAMGRAGPRHRGTRAGSVAVGGGRDQLRPAAPGRVQMSALGVVRRRPPAHRLGQAAQAGTAGTVLGRSGKAGQLTRERRSRTR
jgi:non-ribosomal peptide synthetase component F